MIGIKTKNTLLMDALCHLYPQQMIPFQKETHYECILTDDLSYQNTEFPVLYLGKDVKLPFSLNDLQKVLCNLKPNKLELTSFYWHPDQRILIEKHTQKQYSLTQKENELILFLWQHPLHQATKEEILSKVWHYHEKANTHTFNTHLYRLHKKLSNKKIISFKKGVYRLV